MCLSSTFCVLGTELWVREYRVLRIGEAPGGDRRPGGPQIVDKKDRRWQVLWSEGGGAGQLPVEATPDGATKGLCQEDTYHVRPCSQEMLAKKS